MNLYRVFFPTGLILGLWGVLLWILNFFQIIEYPGAIHPTIMMGGFVLSFACGFLLTAIPHLLDTHLPSKLEIQLSFILSIIQLLSHTLGLELFAQISSLMLYLFLFYFILRRIFTRSVPFIPPLIFVFSGLFLGAIGNILLITNHFHELPNTTYDIARKLYLEAGILCFLLGLGSRLFPALLGHKSDPHFELKQFSKINYAFFSVILFLSYCLEPFHMRSAFFIRLVIMAFVLFYSWQILKRPKRKAILAYGLWISAWMILISHLAVFIFPEYQIHFMHLYYVNAVGLITLLISTRVTLSHGKFSLDFEVKSKSLVAIIFLIIVAGLTRVSAGLLPHLYETHLLYAGILWIIALLIWSTNLFFKILFPKT